jgi:heptosyltransferase-1
MRILIIKTSAMGDIIHALPILDYLYQVVPAAQVDWVVEEQFADLLSGNPLLAELRIVRTRRWRRQPFRMETVREIRSLWRELREQQYDYVFDIQGNLKSGIIAWATGAERSIGFSKDHLQESLNSRFIKRQIPQRKEDDHAGGRYLRIVSVPFGRDYLGMKLTSDIYANPDEESEAEDMIRECGIGPVFLFHCGTTWQTKFWSDEGWIRLGKLVCNGFPDTTMLFSWGNDAERDTAERLATSIGEQARVIGRKLPLKGIAALLKKVDVVVGGDTGLIHLAAALGTPTVSYYRASDGSVSGPRGSEHVIVQSPLACTRCQRTSCDKDAECRSSISADVVYGGIEKIMTIPSGQEAR